MRGLALLALAGAVAFACSSSGTSEGNPTLDADTADATVDAPVSPPDVATDAGVDVSAPSPDAGDAIPDQSALCTAYCEHLASVPCASNPDLQDCIDDCVTNSTAQYSKCAAEVEAYHTCSATELVLTCTNGKLSTKGCVDQFLDYGACVVCIPFANEDPCTSCRRTNCCTQWTAFLEHPDWAAVVECVNACEGSSCGCVPPDANIGGLSDCVADKCPNEC
jgi:hypothetical protein